MNLNQIARTPSQNNEANPRFQQNQMQFVHDDPNISSISDIPVSSSNFNRVEFNRLLDDSGVNGNEQNALGDTIIEESKTHGNNIIINNNRVGTGELSNGTASYQNQTNNLPQINKPLP